MAGDGSVDEYIETPQEISQLFVKKESVDGHAACLFDFLFLGQVTVHSYVLEKWIHGLCFSVCQR